MKSVISRFDAKAIQVEDLNHEISCEVLKKRTMNIKIMDSLIKNWTTIYHELMEKAQKYICLDDEVQALREDKQVNKTKNQRPNRQNHENERRSYSVFQERDDRGKYRNYSPLNDSCTYNLMWIRKNDKEIR